MARIPFEADARAAWHCRHFGADPGHYGWMWLGAVRRQSIEKIRSIDTSIWFAPGETPRHGARATMSQIAITEKQNGSAVDWPEDISDGEYKS